MSKRGNKRRGTAWVGAAVLAVAWVGAGRVEAGQGAPGSLTPQDRTEIAQLSAKYASHLGGCAADEFAGLFTPDGVFASGFRGNMQGREWLMYLVQSERHCRTGTERAARPTLPAPALTIEPRADGAAARAVLPNDAGVYEDVYAKTASGWRFKSRMYYTPKEAAARAATGSGFSLSAQDYLDIQQLVARYSYVLDNGAEGGRAYADLFTADGQFVAGTNTVEGREKLLAFASGHRPGQGPAYVRNFATNVRIEPAPTGANGKVYVVVIAIGEGGAESSTFTGGHFEDNYVKMADGWRFKRRHFIPSEGGPTTNVGQPTVPAAPQTR